MSFGLLAVVVLVNVNTNLRHSFLGAAGDFCGSKDDEFTHKEGPKGTGKGD